MALYTPRDRAFAESLAELTYANPFAPERIELEQRLLGRDFVDVPRVWSLRIDLADENPNLLEIGSRAEAMAAATAARLKGQRLSAEETRLHEDMVVYALYHRYRKDFGQLVFDPPESPAPRRIPFYDKYLQDTRELLAGVDCPMAANPAHVFALYFQIRRAFHHIYTAIIGGSLPVAALRGRIWESIFTHDMRRYRRALYNRLGDVATLVTGPTGTGKELVAQAVGLSRYIPFDPDKRSFAANFATCFRALNLSALSPTLIESELFGHRRGAFTGALEDKVGWLEACGPLDTVFLDEIGDLDAGLQVKLLRTLQTRTFQRLGETIDRRFEGKIVAATNQDLSVRMSEGSFRSDFYYRLCADQIRTVALADLVGPDPAELRHLVRFLAKRVIGEDEAPALAEQVMTWIRTRLGAAYPWPGNVRELEQCVRNIMIHGDYQPAAAAGGGRLMAALAEGALTADELLRWYCTTVHEATGSYQETARRLQLDRRTVKAKTDPDLKQRYG